MEKSEFLKRYEQLGGRAVKVKIPTSLRINGLKIIPEKLVARLKKKEVKITTIPFTKFGYEVESRFSLGSTSEYLQGYYYLQGAAAQIPIEVLNPKPNEIVLDCCASPGGKTTQIAQWMKNTGVIIALEKKKERLARLKNNLERMGVHNSIVYYVDARNTEKLGMKFDNILVDAPCSGNYTQETGWFAKRSLEDIKKIAQVQKQILKGVWSSLKKGGTLVYSTCSLEPEENELVIDWFIKNYSAKLETTGIRIGSEGVTNVFGRKLDKSISKCRRFWPYKTGTEGFFIAKLIK